MYLNLQPEIKLRQMHLGSWLCWHGSQKPWQKSQKAKYVLQKLRHQGLSQSISLYVKN
jgi:hypothetical protein